MTEPAEILQAGDIQRSPSALAVEEGGKLRVSEVVGILACAAFVAAVVVGDKLRSTRIRQNETN